MADIRRVKVVVTGYYDIDMADGPEDYGTTDPDKMLAIDTAGFKDHVIPAMRDIWFVESAPSVELTWEN